VAKDCLVGWVGGGVLEVEEGARHLLGSGPRWPVYTECILQPVLLQHSTVCTQARTKFP
jgi:hypothetical protein